MMNRQQLLDRARKLVPVLAARAQDCEDLRQVPSETIADFVEAGFYKIAQPAEFGGFELSPLVLFEVAMELAKGCPSSGWCLCLIGVHNYWNGGFFMYRTVDARTRYIIKQKQAKEEAKAGKAA